MNPDALARAAGSIGLTSWQYFGRGRSLHIGGAEIDGAPVIAAVYSPPFLESNDSALATPEIAAALDSVREDIGRLLTALFWVQASGASLLASAAVGRQSTVRDESGRYWIVQPLAGALPTPLRPLLIGAQSTERWPDDRLRAFAAMLAAGLAPIHKIGRTHLNIGPATVAQRSDGRCGLLAPLPHERAVIAALGRNDRIGLDAWSSPELFDGSGSLLIGPPSDIYSASALLFRLAAGTVPPAWQERLSDPDRVATLLAELAPQCSAPLRDAIAAGLIIDPRQRPEGVGEWLSLTGRSDPPGEADLTMPMWTGAPIIDTSSISAARLAAEKAETARLAEEQAAEAARLEADRAEAARVASELAEIARLDQLRRDAEQAAAEKAKADGIEAERLAAESVRLAGERREAERIAAEREEAERAAAEQAKAEAERIEAERLAAERAEAERVAAEKAEAERLEAERVERARIEAARLAAERAEAERIEEDRIATERAAAEAARIESERLTAQVAEAERVAAEKAEAARQEAERVEAEYREAERAEAQRIEIARIEAARRAAEQAEAARIEAERIAAEQAEAERVAAIRIVAEQAAKAAAEAAKAAEFARLADERAAVAPPASDVPTRIPSQKQSRGVDLVKKNDVAARVTTADQETISTGVDLTKPAIAEGSAAVGVVETEDTMMESATGVTDETADMAPVDPVPIEPSPPGPPWKSIFGAIGLLAVAASFMVWASSDPPAEAVTDAGEPRDEATPAAVDVVAAPSGPPAQLVNLGGRDIDVQPWLGSYFYGDDTGCTSPLTVALQRDGQAVTGFVITGLDGTIYTTAWNSTGDIGGDGSSAATLPTVVTGVTPGEGVDAATAEELTGILLVLADSPVDSSIALRWGGEVAGEERYRRCSP